jgi:UDP-glucose:(heptosyl)LPS alpha-1,3-glucosyltransferase
MKIALVRQRYIAVGGAERYLDALARELAGHGHEIHVFAHRWAAGASGLVFHPVPMIRAPSWLSTLTFAWNCRRVVAEAKCDLVFSLERTLEQDIYRTAGGCHREYLIQRLRHSSPLKRVTIWLNPLHLMMRWLEKRVFDPRHTGFVIANSHQRREEICRHFQFPAERIHVIHNGVDCDNFRPRPERRDRFVLLFVGSGFRGKGLEYCVRALAQLPAHVELRVAGKGKPGAYMRLARRLGVATRLSFAGMVSDMPALYATGDLLVLPAVYESFANVCLEAMACGLPVVTSRINGASEVIEAGRNGAIVEEPANVPALAAAIRQFLHRAAWEKASVAARQTAERLPFSLNVERTLAVIELAQVSAGAQNNSPCKTS